MNIDIIKSYRRKKIISNISLIVLSFIFAISINFVLSESKIGTYLKTSIQEARQSNKPNSDLYMEQVKAGSNIKINIKSNKDMFQVKNIAFSFFYNNKNVKIKDILSPINETELKKIVDYNGTKTINIVFKNIGNIKTGDTIASIFLDKSSSNIENLNLLNTNFTDKNNNIYYLTSSGIEF